MSQPEEFRQRLEQLLGQLSPERLVGFSGLALLCAASALALSPESSQPLITALAPWLGTVSQSVLAGLLQQLYQTLATQPRYDERERLTQLAQALEGEIVRDARLRVEIGDFLDELDAVTIAEQVLRGNPVIHGWLLMYIRRDVTRYQADFVIIHETLKTIEALLRAERVQQVRVPLQRPRRADHFTGREAELAQLLVKLQLGQVVTLCGPGGMGKTALATEALWTLAPGNAPPERFPDGILFHSFYNQPHAALALEAIARAYGEDPRPTPRDAAERVLAGRRALLVLDGAENADDLGAVLAIAGGCGMLVTTRRRRDAANCRQDVAPLETAEAVALLQAWGGARAADRAAAQRICSILGQS
jgi:hypothetical protein